MGKYNLRLKDLENISSKNPNYSIIMKEILNYKNTFFFKKRNFKKNFLKAHSLIFEARNIDISKISLSDNIDIKIPKHIGNISFMAMMELQILMKNYEKEIDFGKYIAKIICIACYSENYKGDYSSNNYKFKSFYNHILNSPIWDMIGIYNWIDKNLRELEIEWNKRFLSVQVEDKDYEQAGGSRMNQFNVINTIKSICKDFNLTYEKAWQVSYALTQTNSYAKATANHIQDQMRQIKEAKMKKHRNQY